MSSWLPRRPGQGAALVTRAGACSYGELRDGVAERMRRLRVAPGVVVVLTAAMTAEFVATLLALLSLERPVAVFSPTWKEGERDARRSLLGDHLEIDTEANVLRRSTGVPVSVHPLTRLILFTTGSTGQPKAVQLSEKNIRNNTQAVIEALAFRAVEAQTLFLPPSYSYGLLGQLLPALALGITTELVERLVDLAESFAERRVQGMLSGVPSHYETILRLVPAGHVCERVTHVVSAGAHASPELRRRLARTFPRAAIYVNYGQTEASPRILCLSSAHPLFDGPATGYPVGDWRLRVSERGELLVSGSQVMLGYLGDEQGTSDKVKDGWLATGDRANIAEDGLVTITGRMDELVNVGGELTGAFEIESALRRVEGVRDTAVVFVPDDLYGAAPVAYVEPTSSCVQEETLLGELARLLSRNKLPRELRLIPALPRNEHGKVDRPALRALLSGGSGL